MAHIKLSVLALPALLAGCAPEPEVLCFVAPVAYEAESYGLGPPAPRTVLREVDYSTGCVIVPLEVRDYRLAPGEETAGTLVTEGSSAVLTLSGVAFFDDGRQERRTLRATFALPLTLPARASEAVVTTRSGVPGGPIEEGTVSLGLVRLDAVNGAQVSGDYGGVGSPISGRFDGPVEVSGL